MAQIPKDIKLIQYNLPERNYYREKTNKTQIVWHHTGSNGVATSSIDWWANRLGGNGTIGACIVIDRTGVVYQAFSSAYWANSIGLGKKEIEKRIIAIELSSWGGLRFRNGSWRSYAGTKVSESDIVFYDKAFRGYTAFQKYSDAQIEAAVAMTKYFSEKYEIPITFEYDKFFKYSKVAVGGESGLFSHVSYRKDKNDCHPQPSLIEALKSM